MTSEQTTDKFKHSITTESSLPALPQRDPIQVDLPAKFGLDRLEGQSFEPASPAVGGQADEQEDTTEESLGQKTLHTLANSRSTQVEAAIKSVPAELVVGPKEYFDTIHSNDAYIEVLSEVEQGNYELADSEMLYAILTRSLRLSQEGVEAVEIDEIDSKPFEESIASLGVGGDLEELVRVYAVVERDDDTLTTEGKKKRTPHPLITLTNSVIKSIRTKLVLATMVYSSITSQELQFLVLRSIEDKSFKYVIDSYNSGTINAAKLQEMLGSDEFWTKLLKSVTEVGLSESLVHSFVVYGVFSLVDTLAEFITEGKIPSDSIEIRSDISRFLREHTILDQKADILATDETISKERARTDFLKKDLAEKNDKYEELLNNYKQLNEERFSDETVMNKLQAENRGLRQRVDDKNGEISVRLSNFEVIKANNDKNEEISEMNSRLRAEIKRLTLQIDELKLR